MVRNSAYSSLSQPPNEQSDSILVSVPGRAQRLLRGWSANLVQLTLGVTQQVVLVPIFLHFWSGHTLAAWLALYAAANLFLVADLGLQLHAINRFLSLKSLVGGDCRTANFYAATLQTYSVLAGLLVAALLCGAYVVRPSVILGFPTASEFDAAFIIVTAGTLLTLPSNLVTGLYRARAHYSRAVWLQCAVMLVCQVGQVFAIATTESLLVVAIAYLVPQLVLAFYLLWVDVHRLFPFLRAARVQQSWRWSIGQLRSALPFAVAGGTEIALQNLPVLLLSAFVSDRVAVVQWGLTRVVAGLLRSICVQTTLPLAAELGQDYALGATEKLQLLYARGSIFLALLGGITASGILSFWPDFFALWTHGAVPYDATLTTTLLIGAAAAAPSMLAVGFANYSDRGGLLALIKGLQFAVFLGLSLVLISNMGVLGLAIAVAASELLMQGILSVVIITHTLQRPVQHIAFLIAAITVVTVAGWSIGTVIGSIVPGVGMSRIVLECSLWVATVGVLALPAVSRSVRKRLVAIIPR